MLDFDARFVQAVLQVIRQRVECGQRSEISIRQIGEAGADAMHLRGGELRLLDSAELAQRRGSQQRRREMLGGVVFLDLEQRARVVLLSIEIEEGGAKRP